MRCFKLDNAQFSLPIFRNQEVINTSIFSAFFALTTKATSKTTTTTA